MRLGLARRLAMPAAARGRGDAALLGTAEKGGPGTEMDRCLLGCREAERDEEGRALKSVLPAECLGVKKSVSSEPEMVIAFSAAERQSETRRAGH